MNTAELGIDESLELANFLTSVGADFQTALADGKISRDEILSALISNSTALPVAVGGANKIPAELRNLSEAEFLELWDRAGRIAWLIYQAV